MSLLSTTNFITFSEGRLNVPDRPAIPFIAGDGIGPEVWQSARQVLDAGVQRAYAGQRALDWRPVLAGQAAFDATSSWLPVETLQAFAECRVGIKGPLTTPVGEGIRSLNVALRKELDLYACVRPVRWFPGVPAPLTHPERVDMVVFRENTEDLYSGIEFASGSPDNRRFLALLEKEFPQEYARLRFPDAPGLGIKPVSREGSQRLARAAIRWALANRRRKVTLVHKGNIMKFTEGAFRNWAYDLAESEFAGQVSTARQWERTLKAHGETAADQQQAVALQSGAMLVDEIITDAAFETAITRPQELDVLATTNLNGDYLSDALAALVGGLGMAPGANINFESGHAVFEATHGTAPRLAGRDAANPVSLILSGEMLLRHLGWDEAADRVIQAIQAVFVRRIFTADLHAQDPASTLASTTQFTAAILQEI